MFNQKHACPECGKDKKIVAPYVIGQCSYCRKQTIAGTVDEKLTMEDIFPGIGL